MTAQDLPFLPYALIAVWMVSMLLRRYDFVSSAIFAGGSTLVAMFFGWALSSPWIAPLASAILWAVAVEALFWIDAYYAEELDGDDEELDEFA